MATSARQPLWLPAAPRPGVQSFAMLYFIETMMRASLATIIPVQLLDLLQNKQQISFLYVAIAFCGLFGGFLVPILIRRFARRWVYSLGILAFLVAATAFATFTIPSQIIGMLARVFGTACIAITFNLYIMDFIRKKELVRGDTVRMAYSMIGWTVAPYTGVWLYNNYGPSACYGWSAFWALVLFGVFWYFRLSDNKAIQPAKLAPANPFRNVGRFVAQPRLRLAWLIAFGRSSFWSTFFVYGPILMVTTGKGNEVGGLLISAGNAMLLAVLMWGPLGERYGVRKVAAICFFGMMLCLAVAAYSGELLPWVTAGFLLGTAFFATGLDAVGSVPFYRAVHPLERPQMTAVYRTYLDMGEMLPQLIYGILLGWFGIGSVFFALSALMALCGLYCWSYLNKRI